MDKQSKTNIIGKILGLYKNKAIVLVEDKQHKIEEHAFEIDEKGKIIINKINSEKYYENPTIEGTNYCYDKNSNALMLRWREGEKFATPIFEKVSVMDKRITSEHDDRLISLGRALEKYDNPRQEKKNELNNLYLAMAVSLICNVATVYCINKIAESMGVALI